MSTGTIFLSLLGLITLAAMVFYFGGKFIDEEKVHAIWVVLPVVTTIILALTQIK